MGSVHFHNYCCRLVRTTYQVDGSICLRLVDEDDGSPIATATLCLVEYGLTPPAGHCYIKNYSENFGILDALTEAGVVEFTGTIVPVGYVQAHLCRVL